MGLRGWAYGLLVALLLVGGARAQVGPPQVQKVPGTVTIADKDWRAYLGDDPRCAEAGPCRLAVLSEAGKVTEDPLEWWEQAEVTLPAGLREAPELGVLMNSEFSTYAVFVNGQAVGGSGNMKTLQGPLYGRWIFRFPGSLARDGKVMIAVHVRPLASAAYTDRLARVVGTPEALTMMKQLGTAAELRQQWPHFVFFFLVGCAAVLFLMLYLLERRSREYLWLGLLLLAYASLRIGELGTIVNLHVSSTLITLDWAVGNGLIGALEVEFAFALMRRRVRWPFRVLQVIGFSQLAYGLFALPLGMGTRTWLVLWVHRLASPDLYLLPVTSLVLLLPLRACWRSRDREMKWIGGALIFLVFMEVNRYLYLYWPVGLPQDVLVGKVDLDVRGLAFLLFSVVMLVAMMVRFRRVQGHAREMEKEFEAARTVQQVLIPDELPVIPGLAVESAYLPAREVGGDFFQVLPLASGATMVVVGDVSGKGLPAAMTVSLIVGTVRTLAEYVDAPGELLEGLNRRLYGRGDGFATCVALRISSGGQVRVANAGHPAPYVAGLEVETEPGLPLGIVADICYEEKEFSLRAGERLTLVTDGVIEAMDSKTREMFGFERTRAGSGLRAEELAGEAFRFGAGAVQGDDITVVCAVLG